jgi:hypothetical protein
MSEGANMYDSSVQNACTSTHRASLTNITLLLILEFRTPNSQNNCRNSRVEGDLAKRHIIRLATKVLRVRLALLNLNYFHLSLARQLQNASLSSRSTILSAIGLCHASVLWNFGNILELPHNGLICPEIVFS